MQTTQATQNKAVTGEPEFDAVKYLQSKRWKPAGDGKWTDPTTGGKDKVVDRGINIKRNGQTVALKQTVVQSATWAYPQAEAVAIQQARDGK